MSGLISARSSGQKLSMAAKMASVDELRDRAVTEASHGTESWSLAHDSRAHAAKLSTTGRPSNSASERPPMSTLALRSASSPTRYAPRPRVQCATDARVAQL